MRQKALSSRFSAISLFAADYPVTKPISSVYWNGCSYDKFVLKGAKPRPALGVPVGVSPYLVIKELRY